MCSRAVTTDRQPLSGGANRQAVWVLFKSSRGQEWCSWSYVATVDPVTAGQADKTTRDLPVWQPAPWPPARLDYAAATPSS